MFGIGHRRVGLVGAHVGSHALSLVKDLHRGRRGAHFHGLPGQRIGHAVEAPVELDVIVDVHRGLRPLGQIETLGRQAA